MAIKSYFHRWQAFNTLNLNRRYILEQKLGFWNVQLRQMLLKISLYKWRSQTNVCIRARAFSDVFLIISLDPIRIVKKNQLY